MTRAPETEFERGIRQFGNMLTQMMLLLVLIVFAVNVSCTGPRSTRCSLRLPWRSG